MALNQYHRVLLTNGQFIDLLDQIEKEQIPPLPRYDFEKDNVRELAYKTALRDGFLLCLSHLRSTK